jgi:hypothetical protein
VVTGQDLDGEGAVRLLSGADWKECRQRLQALGEPPQTIGYDQPRANRPAHVRNEKIVELPNIGSPPAFIPAPNIIVPK